MKKTYFWTYFWVIAVFILIAQVIPGILAGLYVQFQQIPFNLAIAYAALTGSVLALIIICYLLRNEIKATKPFLRGKDLLWGITSLFGLLVFQMTAALIIQAVINSELKSENTEFIVSLVKSAPLLMLSVALIGPILEEIVFRKVIFGSLRKFLGVPFAAVISSLLFAVAHGELSFLPVYFGMGLILALIYQKSGRIAVPIIAHCSMNLLVMIAQIYAPNPL